jgi:choline dehydrogenase
MAQEIGEASALSPYKGAEIIPGPGAADNESFSRYLRYNLMSGFDYAGTCRMGADHMAVVDADLRVRGIDSVRIADASVIPSIPSFGIGPAVLAIAERAADLMSR